MVKLGIILLQTNQETPYMSENIRRWIQQSEIEIVPILPSITGAEAAAYFDYIDGLFLLPGIAGVSPTPQYNTLVNTFLTMAYNSSGFPVWGTCQGFEQMIQFIGGIDILESFNSKDYFKQVHGDVISNINSKILKVAPPKFLHQTYIPYFNHTEGISVNRFNKIRALKKTFRILARAHDRGGKEYVALIEGIKIPWYGCQFHPENHQPMSETLWLSKFIKSELERKK
jgi:anthranilate/para-aminobenzoate synthase component II